MSNLTPEDVDLKLASVHEKLNEEDMRLWEGLEDEKISRIAGDEANKKFTLQVQNENQGTESRLSTEVIHRSEGDLVNVGSLNALAQAMSEYRIKTDLELANEAIARQQLGVTLDTKINNFVASWDHTTMSIYSAIQAVQDDVTIKNYAMDMRIRKYEDMLQDITTDSIQITMDNGEINMGAWTILSQAREWDLEILGKFKDYKVQTDKDINDAIEDIQNKLPVKEEIIKEAIEALSNAPIIKELENEIGGLEVTIDGVSKTMMEHRIDVQNEMINLSKELGDKVTAETNARVDALNKETTDRINEIQKETAVRTEQFRQLDDGLTVEIQERIDGDNKAYELIENLKTSNETNLADVYQKISVNTTDIAANASKIEQVTAEVQVAQGDANQALVNAATALEQANSAATATNALAERVTQTETKLGEKVDTVVFNQTKSEVERIDGVTKAQGQEITTIKGNVETMDGVVKGHTSAIDALTVKQTEADGKLTLVTERTTALESSVGGLRSDLDATSTAVSNLKTTVDKQGQDITAIGESVTKVDAKIDNISVGGTNYITDSGTWKGDSLAGAEGITATYSADRDVLFVWAASGNNGWLTNFLSPTQVADVDSNFNLNDDVIFSVDVWIESGSTPTGPSLHWKDSMSYQKLILAPGQELRYDGWYRFYHTRKYVPGGHRFHFSFSGMTGTYRFRNPVIEAGTKPSSWKKADADFASSSALNTLQAQVNVIDGKATATANDLTVLKSTVDNNHAEMINNYYTKVATDQVIAAQINSFKSTLSVGGRNLARNTSLPVSGYYWLFQEPLTRKISGEVTITWEVEDLSGQPVDGGLGFNMGDSGTSGYNYFTYPSFATGKHKWTGSVDSGTFTHLGFYSNTNCIIKNVKIEDGSVPSTWTPAPEDLEIGGRNLLYNSDFRKGLQYWSTHTAPVTVQEAQINNKLTKYVFIKGSVGGLYMQPVNIPHATQAGDIMTLSFLARGNGAMNVGFDDAYQSITVDGTWRRYTITKKRLRSDNVIMYTNGAAYADVALPKLEIGDKATDWSPAPEDNIQDIEAQATAVNSISTQVQNIDGKVTAMASQVLTLESFKNNIDNGEIPGNRILEVDLRDPAYGQDTYFPVLVSGIPTTSRTHLRLMATLDNAAHPNWATHAEGFSVTVDWETTGSGWGTIDSEQVINNAVWGFTLNGQSPFLGPDQDFTSSQPLIWLRGGGRYYYSVPSSRSFAVCPPNGTLTSNTGNVYPPLLYNASQVPVSLNQSNKVQSVKLQQTNEVVDGVKAVSTTSVNNNGFISGFGLISQLINGVVTSAFGVDADYFYVGKSISNAKKPFMVLTSPQTIGGVTYPAGVWMDVAVIANATIGTAHIRDASITNAKIVDLNADKITAGTINADRIGANSINTEKLTIGDFTNLWGNQYMKTNGARPQGTRTQWYGGGATVNELKGGGVQMWGRDHIAPYSTRIPLKPGDTFVIEYSAGQNSGPTKALGVGLWVYDGNGGQGSSPFQFGSAENLGALGGGWYRWRRTFVVNNNGSGQPAAYGCLYFQLEQGEQEANPAYWTAGDIVIRKAVGAELIVNGAITADKLYSNTVSGMFANFGRFETSIAGKGKTVISGTDYQVFDASGKERIFIGIR